MHDTPRLVLASGSPRRAEILRRLGLAFEAELPSIAERMDERESPAAAAERLAREKALSRVADGALSLGCDTLVVHAGRILGKPDSAGHAVRMLAHLAGDVHVVYTGIALAAPDRLESSLERTRVWFRPLGRVELEEYVETGEPLDKAGAYGIQAFGAAIVDRIEGDYFNVMGLPVQRLLELFQRFGWRYAFGQLVPAEPEAETVSGASSARPAT